MYVCQIIKCKKLLHILFVYLYAMRPLTENANVFLNY